ncbi:hypothetical protein NDU88_003734 [Pleurodeles waltl]|uniref:Uncharacterized protein n=1 Tax=Pleurodeles waltl TaxID=8319 RepID=A0AAV7V0V5_PLEWA|nr:hypothetical protein NDU88_003734 [Pleurodeles waltl]
MAPLAKAASPPSSTSHRGTPLPGPRSHLQGGEALYLWHAPPGSRAPQRNRVVSGQAQPGPTTSRGHGPTRPPRATPASAAPPPQGEPLPGPHSSFAAARQLRARRSASGPARHRQDPWHPTGTQGSEPANSRMGGPGPFAKASSKGEHLQHLRIRRN